MKNILILSPDSPENGMGGLGTHIREVLKRIDTTTYSVTALCQGAADGSYQNGAVKVYGVSTAPAMGVAVDGFVDTFFMQTRFVAKYYELQAAGLIECPDLIHVCDWTTAIAGEELSRITGAETVFAVHLSINNYISEVNDLFKINCQTAKQIEFNACRKAVKVLHVSKMYSDLFPFNFFKHKTEICYNGVDYEAFGNAEAVTLPGSHKVKVMYVGRFVENKNPQALWSINIPANVDLLFIGGGNGGDENLVNSLKGLEKVNDHVHYLGPVYGQDKINMMAAADLIVMPSAHEPFGLVALEALAAGQNGRTILAASFADGLAEFLTPEAAINCGTTRSSIEKAVESFLNMYEIDKTDMRAAGCKIAQSLSWGACTDGIQTAWADALGIKPAAASETETAEG